MAFWWNGLSNIIHAYFGVFAVYVSPVTMGLTALNRYTRICKSDQQYNLFFSKKKSLIFLHGIFVDLCCSLDFNPSSYWSTRILFCAELCRLLKQADEWSRKNTTLYRRSWLVFRTSSSSNSYRKVLKKIREHNTGTARNLRTNNNETVATKEIRLSKSLFVVVFAFMLCWLPVWVITILTRFLFGNKMPRNVQLLCTFSLNISNAINPFIYAGMNPVFRREFRRLLLCRFGGEKVDNHQLEDQLPPR